MLAPITGLEVWKFKKDSFFRTNIKLLQYVSSFNLASEEETREALHTSYSLTSALASVIHCNSSTPSEPVVLQVSCAIFFPLYH